MKRSKMKKKLKNLKSLRHELAVGVISLFAVLFVVNMNQSTDEPKAEPSQIKEAEFTLDSYIGYNLGFRNSLEGKDSYPAEIVLRTRTKSGLYRVEIACEYNKDVNGYYAVTPFRMVQVYKNSDKPINLIHRDDQVRSLDFANKEICQFWVDKIYSQIQISKNENQMGELLPKSYKVKFDMKSNMILEIVEIEQKNN